MNYDKEVLIKTLFLEAGSTLNKVTSIEDVIAVAWNIRNRLEKNKKRFGLHIHEVCLKRKQYSCWNKTKPEDIKIGDSFEWKICEMVAEWVISANQKHNPIKDVTHYFNPDLCLPGWSSKMKKFHYTPHLNHIFFIE